MENHIGNLMSRVSQNTPRHVNTINVSNNEDITQNISNITKVMPSISYELSINDSSLKKSTIMTSSFISSDSSKKFKPLADYETYQEAKEKSSHVDSMCTTVARTGSHIRNWEDLLNFNFRYHDFAKDLSFYDKRVKVAQEVLNEQGTEYERKKSLQSNFWFDEDEPVIHSIAVSKKYENDNLLKNDSMKRIQSRIFMCHICGQMFKGRSSFRSHIARHSKVKQYKCKYCLRSFSQSSTLKNHVRIHTGERPFSCLVCNESFRTSSSHHKHLTKHSFSRPFKCDICKKAFKSKPTLNAHYKMHDGKPLNCDSCDSTFPSKRALSYHIQKVHIRQKLFKCNVCNKEYATKHNLSQHMAFHSSEKNYSCIICKSSFVWKSGLAAHMKVHSLKIQCDHCGDKFTSSKKLEKHRRRHTTPISHSCSKCDKKFKYLYLLKKHIQRHDKDITCSICGSTFMKKSIFNKHISSHEESEKDIRT